MSDKNSRVVYISGMHCASCEALISQELKKIDSISDIKISHRKALAELSYSGEKFPWTEVDNAVKKAGYQASLEKVVNQKQKTSAEQWIYSLLLVLGLYLIYRYLKWIGLLSWLDVDISNINYGAAFMIGIVASLSTCLMVVGAVIMSFASKYNSSGNFYKSNVKPHLLFHLGRLTTFFLLGGVLGIIGSLFKVSDTFMSVFTIFIALVLLWLALNILGFVPSMSTLGIRMPKKNMALWKKLEESEHALAPVALGAFSFFLPCGFTQSMQLFAMSSGSFLTGAMTLLLFALGTMPVLFGLGVATTRFKNMKTVVIQHAIGFIVLVFAFYTLSSGLAIKGVDINFLAKEESIGNVINSADAQVVNMVVDYSGYTPSVFKLQKGLPVKWVIDGQQVSGCTSDIIVPSLNIKKRLVKGENIIEFTPEKAGTINFSCGMGMVRGKFIVE